MRNSGILQSGGAYSPTLQNTTISQLSSEVDVLWREISLLVPKEQKQKEREILM